MKKDFLSALAGYAVIVVGVFGLIAVCWTLAGPERAFLPGSWRVTQLWILLTLASVFVSALAGGWTADHLSHSEQGARILLGMVIVLGLIFALPAILGLQLATDPLRPETVSMVVAARCSQPPVWATLLNPVLGVMGVMLGSRLRNSHGL